MSDETFDDWLKEQVKSYDTARRASHRFAPNSYGAGYDQGKYDGFCEALGKMAELWGLDSVTVGLPNSKNTL